VIYVKLGAPMTQRKFQAGDNVAHKTDEGHRMTVIGYTGDGKVICRWKENTGFKNDEFLEVELEYWTPPPPSYPVIVNPKPPTY
jgi:uncharacterized protein YodC (DUF2158 family)